MVHPNAKYDVSIQLCPLEVVCDLAKPQKVNNTSVYIIKC